MCKKCGNPNLKHFKKGQNSSTGTAPRTAMVRKRKERGLEAENKRLRRALKSAHRRGNFADFEDDEEEFQEFKARDFLPHVPQQVQQGAEMTPQMAMMIQQQQQGMSMGMGMQPQQRLLPKPKGVRPEQFDFSPFERGMDEGSGDDTSSTESD
jgi:hypothetical protein